MPSADFKFRGQGPGGVWFFIGIERKTLADMLQSMRDGRLAGFQLPRLMVAFKHRYIIVEGNYTIDDNGFIAVWRRGKGLVPFTLGNSPNNFRYAELDKFCQTITELAGVVIIRSNNKRETAAIVCNRFDWYQKPWEKHESLRVTYKAAPPPRRLRRPGVAARFAAELLSIKWVLADRLAAEFSSVLDMVGAPAPRKMPKQLRERWEGIEGIGKVKAAQAWAELRGEQVRMR